MRPRPDHDPEPCHVCGAFADQVHTVWRCTLCGLPTCTACLAEWDDGMHCRRCHALLAGLGDPCEYEDMPQELQDALAEAVGGKGQ